MHKAIFLEGTLRLTIQPAGPILIKAGETGGADPTLPDMEFVRTRFGVSKDDEQVYIPGPSLKGVVRAQCERICRSLDSERHQDDRLKQRQALDQHEWEELVQRASKPTQAAIDTRVPLADNPLGGKPTYDNLDDMSYSSGKYIEAVRGSLKDYPQRTAIIYRRSSFVSQIFGHTSLAGRVRFADAYPTETPRLEERNGVAIDRIYGSVAVGPFNYETVVAGSFPTQIDFKNLTLAQLGLLGLALRDLAEGRIGIGFGKSRGLGRVTLTFNEMSLYYPTCILVDGELRLLGGARVAADSELVGLGALCQGDTYRAYCLPSAEHDRTALPEGLSYQEDALLGVRLTATSDDQVRAVWGACMPAWKREIGI